MKNGSIDISELEEALGSSEGPTRLANTEINKVPYGANRNKFVRVAFDMFQSKYDDTIWELLESNDGMKYLVKRTEFNKSTLEAEASDDMSRLDEGEWSVSYAGDKPVTLYFLSVPIKEFSPQAFSYTKNTRTIFGRTVLETIKSNPKVAQSYVRKMSVAAQILLSEKCKQNALSDQSRLVFSWIND